MDRSPLPPGVLQLVPGRPNPAGGTDALYLLTGDVSAAADLVIVPGPGVVLPPPPHLSSTRPFRLTVLHFNDLHGRLADVTSERIGPVFSRMAGYFRSLRAGCQGRDDESVLVLAAGDDLVGTAFADFAGTVPAEFVCHPVYRVYSAAGVDAAGIGNHDLDWGLGMLLRAIRHDATFPLLAANLSPGSDDLNGFRADATWGDGRTSVDEDACRIRAFRRLPQSHGQPAEASSPDRRSVNFRTSIYLPGGIYPAALFVVNGLRVGLIGLTTASEVKQVVPGEFTVTDPVEAARRLVPALRPLCDVLIILSHLGQSLGHSLGVVVGAGDVELARALPRGAVHVIVGAHTHSALNPAGLAADNIVNGIPIVQAGANAQTLGEVHISVGPAGAAVTDARLHRVGELPADADFEAAHVRPLAEQVQTWLARPIGVAADHPDLDTARVREGFAAEESALANFLADAIAERCRAAGLHVDFAAVDASSLPVGLPRGGPLTYGDLFRLLPYSDSILLCQITPAQLHVLLDDNARRADRPDEPHTERGFLQFSRELRYTVVSGPERAAAHAADITLHGVPLADLAATRHEPLVFACSNFVRVLARAWERVADADGIEPWDWHQLPRQDTGLPLRAQVLAFVRERGGVLVESGLQRDGRLTFQP